MSALSQDLSLLTTKLYIPPPRPNLVPRARLLNRLDEGVQQGHRLTLVSAPPGFGKTTLVTEWVCASPREVAWISLDEGDNDPVQFLTYLLAALQQVDGRIGLAIGPLLRSPGFAQAGIPSLQSLVTPLINDVTAAATPLLLVLDDYQLISAGAVHQIVSLLLERQPLVMHTVISTRQDPPFPLHQWRARGQMTDIRERDLRFTAEEAAAFLQQTMGLHLSVEAVATLKARTEGWIAGLQLAALALQEQAGDPHAFVAAFAGDDRYVAGYLVAEVLQRQPEQIRHFLRGTAILDRLTAPLCDALVAETPIPPSSIPAPSSVATSQQILEHLEQSNLFLIPLDHRHEWYRYHRLFAEALRTTLSRDEQARLHQRAASWYEAQRQMGQAIQHALACASISGGWSDARRLIRLAAEETLYSGGLLTVAGWLDALPEDSVRADAELATYQGWVSALTGDMPRAEEHAALAEAKLRGQAPGAGRGKLLALRSFVAVFGHQAYGRAIELAQEALQVLDRDQAHWRVIALWALAESQERTADITQAIATLREAQRTGRILGNQVFAATVELFLAVDLHLHGQRRQAIAVCEEAIAHYTDELGRPSPVTSLIFSRLGTLHYEADQLARARQYLEQGLALATQLALPGPLLFCHGFAAPTLYALGETGAAMQSLRTAYQLTGPTSLADADWLLALEADLRLRQGDLPAALRWAESLGLTPDDELDYLHMDRHLVYTRLLLAQDRLSEARRWLARLERFTRERQLYRWLITVHVLQARTAARSGDRSTARDRLARAVELAAPEEYFRAFRDEGDDVPALLPDVRAVAPAFVDQLLAHVGLSEPDTEATARFPTVESLVEPLSERELEVLRLIATGLTNREIAQQLVIATGTVKRHINNLYGKLGVHSRTQALARARDLGLL